VTVTFCPGVREVTNGASWCCNLLPGHVGVHDDGIGGCWADESTNEGPGRLQVAAVNLIGSVEAWATLRPVIEDVVGVFHANTVINALHGELKKWATPIGGAR
jgi:hypothetical protein